MATFHARARVPVVASTTAVPLPVGAAMAAAAPRGNVCDQAIGQAGTGKGRYGSSLPLRHEPVASAHLLGTSGLNLSEGSTSLADAPVCATGDSVETTPVTHGVLVPPVALTAR